MGDQNPKAYVHKGGVRILSYLYPACQMWVDGPAMLQQQPPLLAGRTDARAG
jgi:hypothetical protein